MVSITAPDGSIVGIMESYSCQTGTFEARVEADGFIPADTSIEVGCELSDFTLQRLVSMSPELEAGQTRIIMSWETNRPFDIDIHVISVRNSDQLACRTYYGNLDGCTEISQDTDNVDGGNDGAETMTLLDNSINKDYTYLIGIEDYGWGGQGQTDFTQSGAKITITNGIRTEVIRMVADADSLTFPNEYAKILRSSN